MSIGKKIIRAQRNERFEEKWLPVFQEKYKDKINYLEKMFCYRIATDIMTVDYYPKANKAFNHETKKWHTAGLRYLIKNLI